MSEWLAPVTIPRDGTAVAVLSKRGEELDVDGLFYTKVDGQNVWCAVSGHVHAFADDVDAGGTTTFEQRILGWHPLPPIP